MHKRAATTSNIKNALVESQEMESGQILQSRSIEQIYGVRWQEHGGTFE